MRQLNLRPQSSIMSKLLQRRRYLPWGQPKKRNASKQDWWRLSVYKAMLQTWVLKIIRETVSRCPRLSLKLWHLTFVEKETLTKQLLLNLKKSDLELKVQMILPSLPSSNCYYVESTNSPWLYAPFSFLFVNRDSVGLYRYSFVDDGEQSSFAWPQKKIKKSMKDWWSLFFCLHPFLSASWIQYLKIVADWVSN